MFIELFVINYYKTRKDQRKEVVIPINGNELINFSKVIHISDQGDYCVLFLKDEVFKVEGSMQDIKRKLTMFKKFY